MVFLVFNTQISVKKGVKIAVTVGISTFVAPQNPKNRFSRPIFFPPSKIENQP
jgi:hypothetical protein